MGSFVLLSQLTTSRSLSHSHRRLRMLSQFGFGAHRAPGRRSAEDASAELVASRSPTAVGPSLCLCVVCMGQAWARSAERRAGVRCRDGAVANSMLHLGDNAYFAQPSVGYSSLLCRRRIEAPFLPPRCDTRCRQLRRIVRTRTRTSSPRGPPRCEPFALPSAGLMSSPGCAHVPQGHVLARWLPSPMTTSPGCWTHDGRISKELFPKS